MNLIYDLIIIGGGPAGAAAAGGQSVVSEQIFNWIGTVSISGAELANNLKNHVLVNAGDSLEVKEDNIVNFISKAEGPEFIEEKKDLFKIKTGDNKEFLTKTILVATGSGRRKLEVKNADRLEHKGLTYCASCDGPLFDDMDVAVVGGGNASFETAAQLLAYCKSVTLLHRRENFRADEITVEKVLKNPKMKAIKNVDILEIKGDKSVEGIVFKNKNTGKETELKVSGIFVEIGQIPNTDFVKDLVPLDQIGRIKINPLNQKTEVSGIWAAGDCTNVLYHQNNIAAGDAVRALEDIYLHLHTR